MKNGLKYEKKSGILDKKDIISKGRWLKLAVWEPLCVRNYVEAILTAMRNFLYDDLAHLKNR